MEQRLLNAQKRKPGTKGSLHSLRSGGKIPAVVYGSGKEATSILLDATEFAKVSHGITESTILKLSVDGVKHDVFVRERQREPVSGSIIHVDFLAFESGRAIRARVPIHLVGSSIGVRNGGILENPAHDIEVECDPQYLPERIDLDISQLEANHSIHVRDLPALPNVRVLTSDDLVVVLVKFAKAEAAPAAEATAAAPGAAATPAAAAAGATTAPAADKEKEKK